MIRKIEKKPVVGVKGIEKLEKETEEEVEEIERKKDDDFMADELNDFFYFSVVFNTQKERDAWCKEHNIKLCEEIFVKAKDFEKNYK